MKAHALLFGFLMAYGMAGRASATNPPVRGVVDHTVNGALVRRTVVFDAKAARPARSGDALSREAHAMWRGWSVSDREGTAPKDPTEGGRLQEIGRRTTPSGKTIIKLAPAHAGDHQGAVGRRVYSQGHVIESEEMTETSTPARPGSSSPAAAETFPSTQRPPMSMHAGEPKPPMSMHAGEPKPPMSMHAGEPPPRSRWWKRGGKGGVSRE